jgi:hypothetical protein
MKKALSLILAFSLLFTIAACAGGNKAGIHAGATPLADPLRITG